MHISVILAHPLKMINVNKKSKSIDNFDVKFLYTNIPVDKCIERIENLLRKPNTTLSLSVFKFIKTRTLCTSHGYFQHNNTFYKQKFGLPMGFSLSGVLVYIYLEFFLSPTNSIL